MRFAKQTWQTIDDIGKATCNGLVNYESVMCHNRMPSRELELLRGMGGQERKDGHYTGTATALLTPFWTS